MTGDEMQLPASVQEIADVIGTEQALYLVGQLPRCVVKDKRYPGTTRSRPMLYVPTRARLTPDHELSRILGFADALTLASAFGGEILQPGNCEGLYQDFRKRTIIRMASEGMDAQAIADLFGMTKTWIKAIVRNFPQEEVESANDNTPSRAPTKSALTELA
jgi:hypothetical protein